MTEEALARKKSVHATIDADELALLQTNLSTKLTRLETLNTDIVELTPEAQLEEEIGRADEYSEKIWRTLLLVSKALKSPSPTRDPPRVPSPRDTTRDTDPPIGDPHGGATAKSKVKLPKISLPHFKGNPMYWTTFWDSYESAVHLNIALSDVDKFNYLRSLLERSAYDAIAGLTLSSANYDEAIEILKKRFGNKQIIISRHMESFLNLSAVSGEQDLRSLRQLYNDVEANI